ncbi:MAG: hypothetical protein C0594_08440 [Marinilabiliales bacterium]|nr:MAG: hypothetical protein C0594_08440 [Marinilabiliales bacterium]
MNKYFFHIIFIFLSISPSLNAQEKSINHIPVKIPDTEIHNLRIEGNYGFIWRHRTIMDYFIESHNYAGNIEYLKRTTGKKSYEQIHRLPYWGLGLSYNNLRNNILGNAAALYGFLEIPVIEKPKYLFSYQISSGLGLLTKKFHPVENYFNLAIGSNINIYIGINFRNCYYITKKLALTGGFRLAHYSNGGTKKPNLGINIISLQAGIQYRFGEIAELNFKEKSITLPRKKTNLNTWYSIGFRSVEEASPTHYIYSSISGNYAIYVSGKRKIGAGLDLIFDESLRRSLIKAGYEEIKTIYYFRPGIFLSHDFIVGNLDMYINAGAYIYSKWKNDGSIYSRFGLRYHFKNQLFANISVKTHFAKAQVIEWGVGYTFMR